LVGLPATGSGGATITSNPLSLEQTLKTLASADSFLPQNVSTGEITLQAQRIAGAPKPFISGIAKSRNLWEVGSIMANFVS